MQMEMTSSSTQRDILKSELKELEKWVKQSVNLDSAHNSQILSVKMHLEELKEDKMAALEWSYGTVLVMHLCQDNFSDSPVLEIILTKLVRNFYLIRNPPEKILLIKIWKHFVRNNLLVPFLLPTPEKDSKLFKRFVKHCFESVSKSLLDQSVALDMVVTGTVTCIVDLIEHPSSSSSLNNILDLLFMELVEPSCSISKNAVEIVLRTCGWKVKDAIRNRLNPVLLQTGDNPYLSLDHVYKVIFELVSIEKYLVLGFINNTELCFMPGREDHEAGLKFFCELFGSKSTVGPDFYTTLWNNFLVHCREIITCESQLLILGKHTCSILGQPAARMDWCSLLAFFFEHVLDLKVEISFVTGMTDALLQYYSQDIEPLMELFKKLLTPNTIYERFDQAREILILKMAKAYKLIAGAGVENLTLLKNREISCQLISCFLGTCSSFTPPNEDWVLLRKIFVKHLVPLDFPAEKRMKMLLYLWINSEGKWSVFHELFLKIKRARSRVHNILYIMKDKDTFTLHNMHLHKQKCELDFYLVHGKTYCHYATKTLGAALGASPKLRLLLTNLVSKNITCEDGPMLSKAVKKLLVPPENYENCKIVDGLLYYLTELTIDASAMMNLVSLVKSCVEGHEIASSMNLNRLHVARTALHLLNEILFMLPHLGYNSHVLDHILQWAQSKNSSLSMLSVRCLNSMADVKTLDTLHHNYVVEEVVPLCVCMIKRGSRSQVKAAIQCLGKHASQNPFRNDLLKEILAIISSQLAVASKVSESFERGVSAIGHFASVSLSVHLKEEVEQICTSHLLHLITGSSDQEIQSTLGSLDSSSNNSWIDWQELSIDIRIKLQAIRALGRCMRYCGSSSTVKDVLSSLERIVCSPTECLMDNLRGVDIDRLRYEAACAILNVFEVDVNHKFVSKELLLALSHLMTDSREEVRLEFAKKLCQGLSPHKIKSYNRGHKRGNLPTCMLGILALLGSDKWREKTETRQLAEQLLQEVFVSRQVDRGRKCLLGKATFRQLYEEQPHLVFENILALAVPILAEHNDFQISEDDDEFDVHIEPLTKAAYCLEFVCAMLCHPSTYGGQVEKVYMMNLVDFAENMMNQPSSDSLKVKYLLMIELLRVVVKHYKSSKEVELLTPKMVLPPPFFRDDRAEPHIPRQNLLSIASTRLIEKTVHEMATICNTMGENDASDDDDGNDSISASSFEQSMESQEAGRQRSVSFDSLTESYSQDFNLGNAFHSTPSSSAGPGARKRIKRH
ncbi:uncharacterized protein LOC113204918 isoform X1 [Frankliniella occidentalis]|uniref:Uncharacterized protein LOC113204918 isoform X1 n=2 Tax=Frankliniella occidentalis TaxID=133901 RepID=A0A6J1S4D7_FRAOC|nr:uncharacterized protein LOC113204918 isoform X1 [Frankliniella occidentalis]